MLRRRMLGSLRAPQHVPVNSSTDDFGVVAPCDGGQLPPGKDHVGRPVGGQLVSCRRRGTMRRSSVLWMMLLLLRTLGYRKLLL